MLFNFYRFNSECLPPTIGISNICSYTEAFSYVSGSHNMKYVPIIHRASFLSLGTAEGDAHRKNPDSRI